MKELGHSTKPPPSASPTEESTEDAPIEASEGLNSNSDLRFLNQVVIFKICNSKLPIS